MRKHTPAFLLALSLFLAACSSGPKQPRQPKQPIAPTQPERPAQPVQPKQPKQPPPLRVGENSPGAKIGADAGFTPAG